MELKEVLVQYCDIKKEIKELEEKIDKLKRKDKTVDIVQGSSEVFPFTQKTIKIETVNKDIRKTIEYYYCILENRYNRLLESQTQVEEFIDSLPTSRLRRIFTYRYIEQLSWVKIANLIGGGITEDSIRMEHNRYLEEYKNNNPSLVSEKRS